VDIAGFGSSPLTVQALLSNGDLYAWGYNSEGQVGDGTGNSRSTPAKVTTGVTKLFSDGMTSYHYGYYVQSFVQKANGLYMCGFNDGGYYAGMGVTNTGHVLTYAKVLLPENDNTVLDMGHFTTTQNGRILLALTSKGNVYTWGFNGQNGIHTDNTNPVPVPQLIEIPRSLK
jgi:alpha-tubulin suppressor-like RCC1 family protein